MVCSVATYRSNTVIAIPSPFFLLKEFDNEVHLFLDTVNSVVQSVRPLAKFAHDGGLGRLEVSDFSGRNDCQMLDTYHGDLRELLDQFCERYLTDSQSSFGILSGHLWIPRIRSISGSDGGVNPFPQPSIAIRIKHSFE